MPEILEYGEGTVRVAKCAKCKSTLSYIPSEVIPKVIQSMNTDLGASYKVKQGDYIRCPVCGEHVEVHPDLDMTLKEYIEHDLACSRDLVKQMEDGDPE